MGKKGKPRVFVFYNGKDRVRPVLRIERIANRVQVGGGMRRGGQQMTRYLLLLLILCGCHHRNPVPHPAPQGFSHREPEPTVCWQMGMDRVFRPVKCE